MNLKELALEFENDYVSFTNIRNTIFENYKKFEEYRKSNKLTLVNFSINRLSNVVNINDKGEFFATIGYIKHNNEELETIEVAEIRYIKEEDYKSLVEMFYNDGKLFSKKIKIINNHYRQEIEKELDDVTEKQNILLKKLSALQ